MFDKDGNGKITLDEIKSVIGMQMAENHDDQIWSDVIKECDQDGTQEINYSEFQSMMKKFVEIKEEINSQTLIK